jgi:hypothetical protein
MKHELPFRIIVTDPLPGVLMRVQKGRDELVEAVSKTGSALTFEFEMTVDASDNAPNFLGKFAQGPKDARFVYVNSGTYAGQGETHWARRAKLSLMSITASQVAECLDNRDAVIETTMPGRGGDGGPTCASVKGIEWKVVRR